jgi:Flp pilus assembly protein TadG
MSLAPILEKFANDRASQIAEFAVSAPLLLVFVVGIFDFGGAYNVKQKISAAAQEGTITAASQTTTDLSQSPPPSNQAPLNAVFNYLVNEKVIAYGTCTTTGVVPSRTNLSWTYTINGCPDTLVIIINRGSVFSAAGGVKVVSTDVNVSYPYHWRFASVIQLIAPGATYLGTTQITGDAVAANQS